MRGKWMITDDNDHEMHPYGPTHSLFVDGLLRVAYGIDKQHGYAQVWTWPDGKWGKGCDAIYRLDDEASARAFCLTYAGLTDGEVEVEA